MAKVTKEQLQDWGTTHYGCVTTALSCLISDWDKVAKDEPKPGEEWIRDMAISQCQKYTDALVKFEELF